ncbi:MAG: hypothetical protein Q9201_001679 [Fulgogasparrea decipioides]
MTNIPEHPSTTNALVYDTKSQTFHFNTSLSVPTPDASKGDHLIRVHTTALCNGELDWPTLFPGVIFSDNPDGLIVPGYDVAGTLITAPPASGFKPGDEIIARTHPSRPGNCREYSICRSEEMALKPQKLTWAEAASVPVSALTAWQALFDHAGVRGFDDPQSRGKKILIIAAAGSVGIWLVQLAKMAGLEVVAQVGNLANERLVSDLGASEVVNHKTTGLKAWAETSGPVDIVFDLLGGKTLEDAWYCVKDNGTLISIVDSPKPKMPNELEGNNVKSEFFIVAPNGPQLAEISRLTNEGQFLTMVDSVWNFRDYEGAFAKLKSGTARGKVVIKVAE